MAPTGPALDHPAAPLLLQYAKTGCPADCGKDWTLDQLEAAITRGAHPSARDPVAAKALHEESLEQVEQGFARVVKWEDLKKNLPRKLKISPIAAIPHKSRAFRKIVDLSYALGDPLDVNTATPNAQAPLHAMDELGKVLPRLIWTLATAPRDKGPILMAKVDLKDGYWRMNVPEDDEHNFAYVLPQLNPNDPIWIVIPSALQMGWKLSPPYFCAASESARDVAETLLTQSVGSLQAHKDEKWMLGSLRLTELHDWTAKDLPPDETETAKDKLLRLLEVYVDDFIGLIQSDDPKELQHFARALLHGIHSVFPTPERSGHTGADPVSLKKLMAGDGLWETRKEILGWILDGVERTIELPPDKVEKIVGILNDARRQQRLPRKAFESLRGKLRHATLGIPAGRALMGPLDTVLRHTPERSPWISLKRGTPQGEAISDFITLIREATTNPTKCSRLVPGQSDFLGYVDACGTGVGGAWVSGAKDIQPTVWRIEWPEQIKQLFADGKLTINDLEAAGILLHFLVLEHLTNLKGAHVSIWCDNTSAVSWMHKMSSSKSRVGQRLLRALCLRMCINETSPLAMLSIPGKLNLLADFASRSFNSHQPEFYCKTDTEFLTRFNSRFPLPQKHCWQLFRLSDKNMSLVSSELQMQPQTMGSWRRITMKHTSIGVIGKHSPRTLVWTPVSLPPPMMSNSPPSEPLLNGSGKAMAAAEIESALKPSKSRFGPSARRLKWTDNPVRPTAIPPPKNTGNHSSGRSKATVAKTRHHRQNLPYPLQSPPLQPTKEKQAQR